jgi:hypothetical protein
LIFNLRYYYTVLTIVYQAKIFTALAGKFYAFTL